MNERARRIRERVERLTESQRAALARLLGEASEGPAQLIGHIVRSAPELDDEALLAFVRERLPEHMIPTRLRAIEEIPRTPAGKVDRRALADAVPTAAPGSESDEPRNDEERALAEIWKEVLDTDRIGIHDDFFELGGDSILSIRVISRAKKAGLVIDSPDFFATPTIAHLASVAKRPADGA